MQINSSTDEGENFIAKKTEEEDEAARVMSTANYVIFGTFIKREAVS